jgi:polysaccharide biosynthesis protein PslG
MKKILFICMLVSVITIVGSAQYRSIMWEKFKYSGPGLKQIGWIATKHARVIESSPWSVGCETLDHDYAKFIVNKDYVGELGLKRARLQSDWAKCEKVKVEL